MTGCDLSVISVNIPFQTLVSFFRHTVSVVMKIKLIVRLQTQKQRNEFVNSNLLSLWVFWSGHLCELWSQSFPWHFSIRVSEVPQQRQTELPCRRTFQYVVVVLIWVLRSSLGSPVAVAARFFGHALLSLAGLMSKAIKRYPSSRTGPCSSFLHLWPLDLNLTLTFPCILLPISSLKFSPHIITTQQHRLAAYLALPPTRP